MTQNLISHFQLKRKKWYYDVLDGLNRYIVSLDPLDFPHIILYCSVCRCQRSHLLVRWYLDSCVFECDYCRGNNVRGEKEMNNKERSEESEIKNNDSKSDTINTSINNIERRSKIPNIEDLLPNGEVFSYPLLEEFLGGSEKKEAVLESADVITGGYGESVTLKLDGQMFRSNSKTIVRQVKQLLDLGCIPVRVNVANVVGKSGRKYFTLRG